MVVATEGGKGRLRLDARPRPLRSAETRVAEHATEPHEIERAGREHERCLDEARVETRECGEPWRGAGARGELCARASGDAGRDGGFDVVHGQCAEGGEQRVVFGRGHRAAPLFTAALRSVFSRASASIARARDRR